MNKYLLAILLVTNYAWAHDHCHKHHTVCVEPGGTREIDGVAVTLDCWRYQTTYSCKEPSDNNCQPLRDQGCALLTTSCRHNTSGLCAVQDLKFSCPVEQCGQIGSVICGKKPFCFNGHCTTTKPKRSKDFNQATAALAALGAASDQIAKRQTQDQSERFIFAGRPVECSCGALNTVRCCGAGRGWAQGIIGCSDAEKKLAADREDQLAIFVGEYCRRDPVLNSCLSRRQVYCVFDSKIARIVQHDGRLVQLKRNFGYVDGDESHPDCSGISIEELKKMNFGDMDFSPIYAELTQKMQNKLNQTQGDIQGNAAQQSQHSMIKKMQHATPEVIVHSRVQERIGDFYERIK